MPPYCHPPSRSATIDVARPQRTRQTLRARPSTAGSSEHPPTLPHIGEVGADNVTVGESLMLYLTQPPSPRPESTIVPTIFLDPVLTPKSAPSQLSAHTHSDSEAAPSDVSAGSSTKFDPLPVEAAGGLFIKYGPDGLVKSGTLRGLVERLISGSGDFSADKYFKETFLTSYRAFTTADELLRLLLEQFEAVSSPLHTTELRAKVRYSVITILELWLVENYVEAKDAPLLQRMREFAVSVQASSLRSGFFSDSAQRLIELIDQNLAMFLSPVPPLTPSSSSSSLKKPHSSSDLTAQVLAAVLTSIEGSRYQKLMDSDCTDWLEGVDGSNAVSSFIAESRKIGYWAQKSILRPHKQSERAENLKYFLLVIKECRKLRNFSSACALAGGVTTTSIIDLKRTYGGLDKRSSILFNEARKLISIDKNFKAYRTELNETAAACIPWLYVHLHDMKIVHRAYPIFIDVDDRKDLINFERCHRVRNRIRQTLDFEVPHTESADRARHAGALSLVNAHLNNLVVDGELRNWLHGRGLELAREEKSDYEARQQELVDAGFVPRNRRVHGLTSPSTVSGSASFTSRTASADRTPISPLPGSGMRVSPVQPSAPRKEVVKTVFSLDVFDRNSERCLDGRIIRPSNHPTASGGYADIWEGLLDGRKVAIKTLRPWSSAGGRIEEGKLLKRLWREYSAWTWVSHPIVLECLGFSYDYSPKPYELPSLISPWMSNGTLTVYLDKNPKADRLAILLDVAEGLSFLHDQHPAIVHGDLRGGNILIADTGRPCLSDFGLSRVLKLEGMSTTTELGGSLRWMSPELLRDDVVASTSSDVWAYAMTVLEIMSGQVPYHEVKHPAALLTSISRGQIPTRPLEMSATALTDEVWAICQKCWNIVPRQRPSMRDVFSEIHSMSQ